MVAAKMMSTAGLTLGLVTAGSVPAATAQDNMALEYAVKIICGSPDRPAVAPGRYFTAINIHNPGTKVVVWRRKWVFTQKTDVPGKPGPWSPDMKLGPDAAVEVECPARDQAPQPFSKGFAVLRSSAELDVVAVYTAGGTRDSLTTMDVERVAPRQVIRP